VGRIHGIIVKELSVLANLEISSAETSEISKREVVIRRLLNELLPPFTAPPLPCGVSGGSCSSSENKIAIQ
jgi:hypothetical protein